MINKINEWHPVFRMRTNGCGIVELAALLPTSAVVAEIGSYAGESTKIFMDTRRIARLYAIDPWLNGYDNWDFANFSDMRAVEAQFDARTIGLSVIKMKMLNVEAARKITEPLDMVYIDGCHRYAAVKEDINIWVQKIKPGGLLAGHDYNIMETRKAVDEFANGRQILLYDDSSWAIRV
jgi:predicted O-methyltransferase YrrM